MHALREVHAVDPRVELIKTIEPFLADVPLVMADGVLVAIYKRPEKTAGGIIRPDAVRDEDIFQGKVGLVVKMGPLAFTDDETHKYGENKPKIHDWVVFRVGDAWPLYLGEVPCRIVTDGSIRAVVARPDVVY